MRRKIIWLLLSCLVVLSLILAACAPAAPTQPTAPTQPVTPTQPPARGIPAAPTAPTAPAGPEMIKDSLGRMVEKPRYGGVFNIVTHSDAGVFDPATNGPSSLTTLVQTHENLIGLDWTRGPTGTGEWGGDFSIAPLTFKRGTVAESWEIPDDSTIIYKIRKGVRFALDPNSAASRLVNGRELTAEDVRYSIWRNFYGDIPNLYQHRNSLPEEFPISITTPDKYTVVVKSNPGYVSAVTLQTGDYTALIPKETVDKYGNLNDWRNSVGTGAFVLVDYVQGSSATFVRNPNYWQKDPFFPENQLPYLQGVKYLRITDPSTILAGLRTGKIDTMSRKMISKDDADSLKKTNPQMQFRKALQYQIPTVHLVMNNPALPWYDLNVRRALNMGIDKEAIVRDYYQGNAEILAAPGLPVEDFMPMYTPLKEMPQSVQENYTYNPAKAKQLLAEAGYPNGFKIEVLTSSEYDVDLASLVKFYWEKIGVNINLVVKERTVFTSMTEGRAIKEAGFSNYSANVPYIFHYFIKENQPSYGMIDDPHNYEVREFVMKRYMLNEPEVWPVMKEFYKYTLEQAWQVFLPTPYLYIPWQPWVKGYGGESVTSYGEYMGQTYYLWLDADLKKKMGY